MKKSFGARLKALFGIKTFDENFFEELEDMLIEGDLGAKTAMEVSDAVRKLAKAEKSTSQDALQQLMKRILSDKIAAYVPELVPETTNIFLILGVNGVGKTTSIAKLATYYKNRGETVLLAAADTFRAAAIDQLELHAQRTGCRIVKQAHGSDPGAVIFDAMQSAKAKGEHLVLADTAGRMHNKENLLRELQRLATTDALTDVYNRRHLDATLKTELDRAKQSGLPLSVIMLDVDHFKKFNDSYGHDQGDRVLKMTGHVMKAALREYDVPCRYGGEEFSIVLPATGAAGALAVAERLRCDVESMRVDDLQVTISLGIACYPDIAAAAPEALILAADGALYRSKDGGRNRSTIATPAATEAT